jgi:hypothetical protein
MVEIQTGKRGDFNRFPLWGHDSIEPAGRIGGAIVANTDSQNQVPLARSAQPPRLHSMCAMTTAPLDLSD